MASSLIQGLVLPRCVLTPIGKDVARSDGGWSSDHSKAYCPATAATRGHACFYEPRGARCHWNLRSVLTLHFASQGVYMAAVMSDIYCFQMHYKAELE